MRDLVWRVTRWFLLVIILVLAVAFLYRLLGPMLPEVRGVDDRLPSVFHANPVAFWAWVLLSAGGSIAAGIWIARRLWLRRRGLRDATVEPAESVDPALPTAWEAILALRRRRPGDPVYLAFAPGDEPTALLAAAGLGPDGVAPDSPAPLRGYGTEEGLFVQCSGAIGEAARYACRVMPSSGAPAPPLRGGVVLIPVDLLLTPEVRTFASAVRAGLRAVAEGLEIRCPVFVILTGMEEIPGFLEFARRMPEEYRSMARFGFSMPGGGEPTHDAIAREFDRFVAWYGRSMIGLIAKDPLDQSGNEGLYGLSRWFLLARKPILEVLEAASIGVDDDPPDVLGCYFAATGPGPDGRAYAESVIRGKVAGDPHSARWSARAVEADRGLRRTALGLASAGVLVSTGFWAYILLGLEPSGWLDPAFLATIAAGWAGSSLAMLRDRRRARLARGPAAGG